MTQNLTVGEAALSPSLDIVPDHKTIELIRHEPQDCSPAKDDRTFATTIGFRSNSWVLQAARTAIQALAMTPLRSMYGPTF